MEFYKYQTLYQLAKKHNLDLGLDLDDWSRYMISESEPIIVAQVAIERNWSVLRGPYYSVYPTVVEPLLRVSLDVPDDCIKLSASPLAFRFAKTSDELGYIRTILASFCQTMAKGKRRDGISLWVNAGEVDGTVPGAFRSWISTIPICQGKTIEEQIQTQPLQILSEAERKVIKNAMRLVLGCLLMANDPEMIIADVLNKDALKYKETGDEKFVKRAKRRGKIGWLIGSCLSDETSPHFRRSHFAIRWTGKGAKIPKIVPVKRCIVHRKKLTEMPTGYLEDEN